MCLPSAILFSSQKEHVKEFLQIVCDLPALLDRFDLYICIGQSLDTNRSEI